MGCEDLLIFLCHFVILFSYNSKKINCDQVANAITMLAEVREGRLDQRKAVLEPPKGLAEALFQLLTVTSEAPSVMGGREDFVKSPSFMLYLLWREGK